MYFQDPEAKIDLYIGKCINGKFWFSGLSDKNFEFFT